MDRFLISLRTEIKRRGEEYSSAEPVETIFFGGGTPSLLSGAQFDEIFSVIQKYFRVDRNAEITCESNPGTVEQKKLREFRSVGFNRVSFGIQSFYEDDLKFLTRIHTAEEAERAVENARRAGFENINVDLIFALPKQTPERWRENIRRAIALKPDHISAYALIVEDETPLATMVKNKIVAPLPAEEDAAMYEITIDTLLTHGYRQYEVSNFALPGFECRHNINYWNHSDYIGFGPSAHSFRKTSPVTGRRRWNVRSIQSYNDMLERGEYPLVGEEAIDSDKFYHEEIFLGLRSGGINLETINQLYGDGSKHISGEMLDAMEREGLISRQKSVVSLTPRGYSICDEIAARLIT